MIFSIPDTLTLDVFVTEIMTFIPVLITEFYNYCKKVKILLSSTSTSP